MARLNNELAAVALDGPVGVQAPSRI